MDEATINRLGAQIAASAKPATTPRELPELQGLADDAYCRYIRLMQSPPCLGWEAKIAAGKFGSNELRAHVEAGEWLGRHRAYSEAATRLAESEARAEAWKAFAEHQVHCAECAESVESCADGRELRDAAIAQEAERGAASGWANC